MKTITHDGLTFSVSTAPDHHIRAPWKEYDCHGSVREVSTLRFNQIDKAPGEVVIYSNRGHAQLYDYQGTIKRGHAEGWGLSGKPLLALNARLKRVPTRREVVAEAVRLDMERMRAWCEDRWSYVSVFVYLLDVNGKQVGMYECIGGMESDDHEGIEEQAQCMAEVIAEQIGQASEYVKRYRLRETEAANG